MGVTVKERGWLKRVIEITDRDETIVLTYNGCGSGYELVSIQGDGYVEDRRSSLVWFISRFDLSYKNSQYVVDMKIWPWLTIKSMVVKKDGDVIYREGKVK